MADIQNDLACYCAHNQQLSYSQEADNWHILFPLKAKHFIIKNEIFQRATIEQLLWFSRPAMIMLMNIWNAILCRKYRSVSIFFFNGGK